MRTLIYPGTFDPFTNGHLDITRRAAKLCDRLIIAVLTNYQKNPIFSLEERCAMVKTCIDAQLTNITVISHDGLLVDFMQAHQADAIVRGLRSESDFRFEAEMAAANRLLWSDFESILLSCRPDLTFTSSSIVREVASLNGDISGMVPQQIQAVVRAKLSKKREELDCERQI